MENNRFIKKIFIYITLVISGTLFTILLFEFPDYFNQIEVFVLVITLAFLGIYVHDTQRIANESVKQTELSMMPIMCLYIRYVSGVKDEKVRDTIKKEYSVKHVRGDDPKDLYYIALRNVGEGTAFNVSLESNNCKSIKYQTQFFEPNSKQHAVKIIKKPNENFHSLDELNDEIFTIKCESAIGKKYEFKFKILNFKDRTVEFIV